MANDNKTQSSVGEFARYSKLIGRAGSSMALREMKADEGATRDWLGSVLTGKSSPVSPARSLTPTDEFAALLFREFMEISASFGTLRALPKLATRAPVKAIGVSRPTHLRFLVEAYLSETYVLLQRCKAYLKKIRRKYRRSPDKAAVENILSSLEQLTDSAFSRLVTARGRHIHEHRHEDDGLSRLEMLELLAGQAKEFKYFRDQALRTTAKDKIAWMTATNSQIEEFLDHYFAPLAELLFEEDGSVAPPTVEARPVGGSLKRA